MSTFKNIYVTFKVTLKCNLACRYCYGRDNYAQGTEMSDDEIQRGLRFVCKYASIVGAESITICWHGGEPFLLARKLPAIIKYANDLFAENGIRVSHGTQTNATLLGPDTYDLINTCFAGFVGVSIDLFSSYRTFPSGKDSTEIAVRNIDNALSSGIRCGAINLITRDNLDRIDDIYDFYKKRKMNVRLSRVFPISNSDVLSSPMYISDEEYAEAMIRFFDRWADDPEPAPNTDIVKLIADLLLGVPSLCLREADCHKRYMAFSPGGDIFSCAEFEVLEDIVQAALDVLCHFLLGGLGILFLDGLEDVDMLLSGLDIMVQLRGGDAHAGAVPETGQEFVEPLVVCRCPDGGVDGKVQLFVFLR